MKENKLLALENKEDGNVLFILPQNNITTYLNYSFPILAFYWNEKKRLWFMEHFTQIYAMQSKEGYLWVDYLEAPAFYDDVLDAEIMKSDDMEHVDDVVSFIKNAVDQEKYTMVFVDKYFLEGRRQFNVEHHSLQIFIYGYDDRKQEFHLMGFYRDGSFGRLSISYNEFRRAFSSCLENSEQFEVFVKDYCCVHLKVKDSNIRYQYNYHNFLNSLRAYIEGAGQKEQLRPDILIERGADALYGIDSCSMVLSSMKLMQEGKYSMDYRQIHLLSEHKLAMIKKMKLMAEDLSLTQKVQSSIVEYEEVVKAFQWLKSTYAKQALKDTKYRSIYGKLKDKEVIGHMMQVLGAQKEKEKVILNDYYKKIMSECKEY